MITEKNTTEIRVQAIKIAKVKQKVLKQSGVPVTASVKAELMKDAMAEARKSLKNIPMVDGKIEIMPEEFALVENVCKKCANPYTSSLSIATLLKSLVNCTTHKSIPITAIPEGNFIWLL